MVNTLLPRAAAFPAIAMAPAGNQVPPIVGVTLWAMGPPEVFTDEAGPAG